MDQLHAALEFIKHYPDKAHFVGARSQEQIEKAEAFLGIQFPPSYQTFIRQLGAGSFAGEEFYGITSDDFEHSTVPNAIWLTFKKRETINLPTHFLIIHKASDGPYLCLDTSREYESGECQVVEWYPHTSSDQTLVVYESFGEYFLKTIEQAKIDLDNEL